MHEASPQLVAIDVDVRTCLAEIDEALGRGSGPRLESAQDLLDRLCEVVHHRIKAVPDLAIWREVELARGAVWFLDEKPELQQFAKLRRVLRQSDTRLGCLDDALLVAYSESAVRAVVLADRRSLR